MGLPSGNAWEGRGTAMGVERRAACARGAWRVAGGGGRRAEGGGGVYASSNGVLVEAMKKAEGGFLFSRR